jgi:GNAT superfamily N-acetyltransferase
MFPGMARRHMFEEIIQMKEYSKHIDFSISEIYSCMKENSELKCHRLNVLEGNAGELILNIPRHEKAITIEEVFVHRGFRNSGLGSRLLLYGEMTAYELGFRSVELRPFSTDPLISDQELKEWYQKRGYRPDGEKMRKRINSKNFEMIS